VRGALSARPRAVRLDGPRRARDLPFLLGGAIIPPDPFASALVHCLCRGVCGGVLTLL